MLGLRISSHEAAGEDEDSEEQHLRKLVKQMLGCYQILHEKLKHFESVLHMSRDCLETCVHVSKILT